MPLKDLAEIWWSAVFAAGTVAMQCVVAPKQAFWPPKFELSGHQAVSVLSSVWFWGCWLPLLVGLWYVPSFAKKHKLPQTEQSMMVWFLANAFWFHTGCDILSGYYQVMPVMTELYIAMNPAHTTAPWDPSRVFLDCGYMLELMVEVPLCILVLHLYYTRHPARHFAEVFTVAVQFAGTVCYYMPYIMRGEAAASWVSYCDRAFGSVWIIFPAFVFWRHCKAAARDTQEEKAESATSQQPSVVEMPTKQVSSTTNVMEARKRASSPGQKS